MEPALRRTPMDVGIEDGFFRRRAYELATDIVLELDSPENLAKSYGVTEEQWPVVRDWPAFRHMVAKAVEELSGPLGVAERARRQAKLAISEFGVHDMAVLMGDPKVLPRDRISAFDTLKDVAGLTSKGSAAAVNNASAGPLIQIFFPDGRQFDVNLPRPAPAIEGEATRE
jgi:hypothetical protein